MDLNPETIMPYLKISNHGKNSTPPPRNPGSNVVIKEAQGSMQTKEKEQRQKAASSPLERLELTQRLQLDLVNGLSCQSDHGLSQTTGGTNANTNTARKGQPRGLILSFQHCFKDKLFSLTKAQYW